jgi:hypothetical protein
VQILLASLVELYAGEKTILEFGDQTSMKVALLVWMVDRWIVTLMGAWKGLR